jgi:RimJ/RimL family protein N-acetyltransferase
MKELPTLETARLVLRPFAKADIDEVARLAGAREVAQYTLHIPHPYQRHMAETWIASHRERYDEGVALTLAVTERQGGSLVGAMGLSVDAGNLTGELGYWIGVPYWSRGYATEAAQAVLAYGFGTLGLERIHARHLAPNVASGRVMRKLGMSQEGILREHVQKWQIRYDLVLYGLLRSEYEAAQIEIVEDDQTNRPRRD